MKPLEDSKCIALGAPQKGYLVYAQSSETSLSIASGKYNIYTIDIQTGDISLLQKGARLQDTFRPNDSKGNKLYWLHPAQR
jgi:hypothetical protein